MIKWVEVLKRILSLYHVHTQAELGMAIGIPVSVGMDGHTQSEVIPWDILEKVVRDKRVSWDWLLTGEEISGGDKNGAVGRTRSGAMSESAFVDAPDNEKARRPPRIETRELVRELLPPEEGKGGFDAAGAETADVPPEENGVSPKALNRQLREIRSSLRQEIEKVDRLLDSRE